MLDFILVMGHVPGTNIDITFTEILLAIPLTAVMLYLHKVRPGILKRNASELYLNIRHLLAVAQAKRLKLLAR